MSEGTTLKTLTVGRIGALPADAPALRRLMDEARIPWQEIGCVNWADRYPAECAGSFRIAHTGDHILIAYSFCEEAIRGEATADGGRVWEDSCCEFFIHDEETQLYNNIECNCIGTLLMAVGKTRENRTTLSGGEMRQVIRWTTVSRDDLRRAVTPTRWGMMLIIPVHLLFDHRLHDISGMTCRANFYKCGDLLPRPHFLSWNPVDVPTPDFHRPDHFGQLTFE